MHPSLTLIIPSFNDRERLIPACKECLEFLKKENLDAEVIVVDDGSLPEQAIKTSDIGPEIRIIQHPRNIGKGGAIRTGVKHARGNMVIFTDSDLPFTLAPLKQTMELLGMGNDIVIGVRHDPHSSWGVKVRWYRHLSSLIFTFLVNWLIGLPFKNTQCGYKGYNGKIAKELFGLAKINSFSFDVEILLIAIRRGYRIFQQPVLLVNNETSTVRLGRHGIGIIRDLFKIKIRDMAGMYGHLKSTTPGAPP